MGAYDEGLHRIARYRICLERDTGRGLIPRDARGPVDRCFASLAGFLESARVAIEGSGKLPDDDFVHQFAAGCCDLARQLFVAMYREPDPRRLALLARGARAEGCRRVEHLWLRLDRAA